MKKILSLTLAALMVVSMVPTAFAADYTAGTKVEYVAADQTAYTITVPALLNPGQSGDVTLSGTWASDHTVKVTADKTVELVNSINSNDKKVLNIGFAGIEKAGDNTEAKSYTEAVSVAAMPSDALFGTWSGKFNYNVEFDDGLIEVQFTYIGSSGNQIKTIKAEEGMTWREFSESSYNDAYFAIANENHGEFVGAVIAGLAGYLIDENNHLVSPDDVIDPNGHYEAYFESSGGSPTFGAVKPTWP